MRIQGLSQLTERSPLVEGLYRARVVRFESARTPLGNLPSVWLAGRCLPSRAG
jgi:hypothetical protein